MDYHEGFGNVTREMLDLEIAFLHFRHVSCLRRVRPGNIAPSALEQSVSGQTSDAEQLCQP